MLGQEKFSKAKTRHLGTIEALLLLSEWYPQALQFHSEVDGWDSDLMYTAPSRLDPPPPTEGSPMQSRWKEDVVEPTRQSDRMSWMLVSSALALAHELGVFDSRDYSVVSAGRAASPDVQNYLEQLNFRRQRLPSVLFVISNLLSSRIGCTSLMPHNYDLERLASSLHSLLSVDPQWAKLMTSWVDLIRLTQTIREKSPTRTGRSGHLPTDFALLEQWRRQLAAWRQGHEEIGSEWAFEFHPLRLTLLRPSL